jgi:heme exporter protein B
MAAQEQLDAERTGESELQTVSLPISTFSLLQAAWAVFIKDLRTELRTRYAINALVLFAACSAVAVSLGVGFIGLRRTEEALLIQATLLWIALLFAALNGLARGFVQEEEARTMAALRLAAPPIAVFLGKFTLNLALLALLGAITTLLFIVMVRVEVGSPLAFALVLAGGSLCLASATTILAAIISKASFKSALFAVLAFPLLVPPLIVAIQGTASALDEAALPVALASLQFLGAYSVATFVASLLLFRFVWEA